MVLAAQLPFRPVGAVTDRLDPSFGRDGVYHLDLTEPSLDVANAAVQARAGLIGAGAAGGRFALAALSPSTSPFNNTYQELIIDFGRPSAAHAIIESGGDLIAAGSAGDDFAVARLRSDGDPLMYFGDQGRVRTSFDGPAVARGLVQIGTYSRVLAVGTVSAGAGSSLAMVRYDFTGALDPSFGSGGKVVTDITPGIDSANAVTTTYSAAEGEHFLVAGQAGSDVLVARYRSDGTPDATFGTGGRVVQRVTSGLDEAHAVAVDGAGRVVVAGSADGQAFVARFSPEGLPDPTFGDGGLVRSAFGGTSALFRGILLDPNEGSMVAAGTIRGPGGSDGLITRVNVAGAVDQSFGTGGRSVIDLGGSSDEANALVGGYAAFRLVGSDGADMVAASVGPDGNGLNGSADYGLQAVDFGGRTDEEAGGVTVLPDGRTILAGSGTRGIILVRLLANGSPDRHRRCVDHLDLRSRNGRRRRGRTDPGARLPRLLLGHRGVRFHLRRGDRRELRGPWIRVYRHHPHGMGDRLHGRAARRQGVGRERRRRGEVDSFRSRRIPGRRGRKRHRRRDGRAARRKDSCPL